MLYITSIVILLVVTAGGQRRTTTTTESPTRNNAAKCGTLPETVLQTRQQIPWVVSLGYQSRGERTVWACLGTLISPKIVVTAAHCVHSRKPEQVLTSVGCPVPPCIIDVARVVNHESYSPLQPEQGNDIALVKLNRSINEIEFVCLPTVSFHPSTLVNQNTFVVATNIHRKGVAWKSRNSTEHTLLEMPVMSNEECQRIFGDNLRVHEADVCAGGQGVEPCHGDSAAPLLAYDDDGRWTLVAIVTLGSMKCADAPYPTVYTNVGAHLRWIQETQQSI